MSKTLNALQQVSEIKRNKLTEALEKARTAPAAGSVNEIHVEETRHTAEHHPKVGVPALMAAVILLGIVFVVINYRVLAELHDVRNSTALLLRKTGVQKGKVSSIENAIAQVNTDNKKLKSDLARQEKVMVTLLEKVQSDVAEAEIAGGIMRSKVSELNSTQKKLLDQYIELSDDVSKLKAMHAGTAEQLK